jgi:hypothetical protein
VPVKFALTGASAGIEDLVARLWLVPPGGGAPQPASSRWWKHAGNAFRYDRHSRQYLFLLDTRRMAPGPWKLRVDTGGDGVLRETRVFIRR